MQTARERTPRLVPRWTPLSLLLFAHCTTEGARRQVDSPSQPVASVASARDAGTASPLDAGAPARPTPDMAMWLEAAPFVYWPVHHGGKNVCTRWSIRKGRAPGTLDVSHARMGTCDSTQFTLTFESAGHGAKVRKVSRTRTSGRAGAGTVSAQLSSPTVLPLETSVDALHTSIGPMYRTAMACEGGGSDKGRGLRVDGLGPEAEKLVEEVLSQPKPEKESPGVTAFRAMQSRRRLYTVEKRDDASVCVEWSLTRAATPAEEGSLSRSWVAQQVQHTQTFDYRLYCGTLTLKGPTLESVPMLPSRDGSGSSGTAAGCATEYNLEDAGGGAVSAGSVWLYPTYDACMRGLADPDRSGLGC